MDEGYKDTYSYLWNESINNELGIYYGSAVDITGPKFTTSPQTVHLVSDNIQNIPHYNVTRLWYNRIIKYPVSITKKSPEKYGGVTPSANLIIRAPVKFPVNQPLYIGIVDSKSNPVPNSQVIFKLGGDTSSHLRHSPLEL